jgi:hypothetical protein
VTQRPRGLAIAVAAAILVGIAAAVWLFGVVAGSA